MKVSRSKKQALSRPMNEQETAPIKIKQTMLSTEDNPFNPFTQFEDWYAYDEDKGYYSCSYLARIVTVSNELSFADQALAIEQAIDSILNLNVLGNYKKVIKEIII